MNETSVLQVCKMFTKRFIKVSKMRSQLQKKIQV